MRSDAFLFLGNVDALKLIYNKNKKVLHLVAKDCEKCHTHYTTWFATYKHRKYMHFIDMCFVSF